MSIAVELMRQVEAAAAAHGAVRVRGLAVRAGAMRGVVPAALEIAWESLAAGTVAEGSVIELSIEPAEARCRACGERFAPTLENFLCPNCNLADAELTAGNDVILESIEAETPEENQTT